ncbi:MAG TPA: glycogen debranching N-terminal domain-containing protein, partial [Candidatus Manganitrophaceae bacterium]|nr:glycogen debranching N-terminal domain-containing protein [Candidatus Manganitrophaceae bacterium]
RMLQDRIAFRNFSPAEVFFPLTLSFQAEFEDIFSVRGLLPEQPGRLHPPFWKRGLLQFVYDGNDNLRRSVVIRFSLTPEKKEGAAATFLLKLQPEEKQELFVSVAVIESAHEGDLDPDEPLAVHAGVEQALDRSSQVWLGRQTEIESDNLLLNNVIKRSLSDLLTLRTSLMDLQFFAAGVPWFATLFGRDSLISALQTLAYEPEMAEQTLRLLARYQGKKTDPWRDEQPGKILHELRVGELARMGEIPYTPYYGTIDATPLFLILIGRHAAWTGSLSLFHDLSDAVEKALRWIAAEEGEHERGYLAYESKSDKGLINQGWKDSGNAIINEDGSLARPPIALVEVQGYVYLAKKLIAGLYRRAGKAARADQLVKEAEALRERFNRDFWLEDRGFYALALQAGMKPAAVLTSNPGHALWCQIADPEKAQKTMERLTAGDMFSGWGIRTLSEEAHRYNPIGYHLGTVWPHDNALIAAGFRHYGYDRAALRLFTGITEAAMHFGAYRLPELFSGFSRRDFEVPVHYPVACHPQAWAAGSVPYLVETSLGLVPEAFEGRLRIVRPVLPDFVDHLEVRRLRVGTARVDLKFDRSADRRIQTAVMNVEGRLDVRIEEETGISM